MKTLYEKFEVLEDPRDIRGKKHKLTDILIMTIYGILCGYTDFVNPSYFLEVDKKYFNNLLDLENGIPSHDTFSNVFASINSKLFMNLFIDWVKDIIKENGSFLSIDGKAIKSATDKVNGGNTSYIVSAFLGEAGLSIGQVKVNDKSNEIKAIPDLLELIDIKNKIITIDALGTQENITKQVVSKKGKYILKVEKNQLDLLDNIKTYFNLGIKRDSSDIAIVDTGYEKDHGRIEFRKYYLSYDISCILDKDKWSTIKAIGMIEVTREEGTKKSIKKHYYILSNKMDVDTFIKGTRNHWNIKCSLHWRLDVVLDEDHSRSRTGNSIENLSTMRKVVFNLTKLDNSMDNNRTLRKKMTRYNHDFKNIENLLFNVIPSI